MQKKKRERKRKKLKEESIAKILLYAAQLVQTQMVQHLHSNLETLSHLNNF